ncbi:ABC transporter domain protein, partial [Reticulomyxa filosa]
MYYDKQAFYYLNQNMNESYSLNKDRNGLIIDNCGQRLCMDVNELCWGLNELLSILMNASAQLFGWSLILYQMQVLSMGVMYLIIFGILFINIWLFASGMSWHSYRAFMHEYDFTSHILRTGEYSEIIALANAQKFEKYISLNRMNNIIRAIQNVAVYYIGMKTLLHLMKYIFMLIPFFLLWKAFIEQDISFGSITQVQLAFVQMIAV